MRKEILALQQKRLYFGIILILSNFKYALTQNHKSFFSNKYKSEGTNLRMFFLSFI